jgi:hypothetical protein
MKTPESGTTDFPTWLRLGKWMPVRQASRLTERQDKEKTRDKRLLARTQFGKRLLLLPCVEASEVIPPEEDEEEWYTEKGTS